MDITLPSDTDFSNAGGYAAMDQAVRDANASGDVTLTLPDVANAAEVLYAWQVCAATHGFTPHVEGPDSLRPYDNWGLFWWEDSSSSSSEPQESSDAPSPAEVTEPPAATEEPSDASDAGEGPVSQEASDSPSPDVSPEENTVAPGEPEAEPTPASDEGEVTAGEPPAPNPLAQALDAVASALDHLRSLLG